MADHERTVADIERAIDQRRADLIENVHALRIAVREELSWRRRVAHSPWPFLGGAFALGLLVGWR